MEIPQEVTNPVFEESRTYSRDNSAAGPRYNLVDHSHSSRAPAVLGAGSKGPAAFEGAPRKKGAGKTIRLKDSRKARLGRGTGQSCRPARSSGSEIGHCCWRQDPKTVLGFDAAPLAGHDGMVGENPIQKNGPENSLGKEITNAKTIIGRSSIFFFFDIELGPEARGVKVTCLGTEGHRCWQKGTIDQVSLSNGPPSSKCSGGR